MLRRSIPVLSVFVLAVMTLSVVTSEASADASRRQARRSARRGYTTNQQYVTPTNQPTVVQPGAQPMPMPTTTTQSGYRSYYRVPTPDAPAGAVLLNVQVPASAKVWIDGAPTTSTGMSRSFVSPPLTPGKQLTYEVKAQWTEGGQQVTRTRRIPVQANQAVDINLQQPTAEELKTTPRKIENDDN